MTNHKTLTIYLSSLYSKYFSYTVIVLALVLSISNVFDVLQKLQHVDLSIHSFWRLVLYKVPYLINSVFPLISFVSTLLCINYLISSNEVIIIIGNGISLQRIIAVIVMTSGVLGLLILLILNPISAHSLKQHQTIEEAALVNKRSNHLIKSKNYFFESHQQENRIIYIDSINRASGEIKDIIILFLDKEKKLTKRIDAKAANLLNGIIHLKNARVFNDNNDITQTETNIITNLSLKNIHKYALIPEMLSIWNFNKITTNLSNAGVVITDYKIYYYKQLSKPIFMMGTALLASCFINIKQRGGMQRKKMFIFSLLLSLIIYIVVEVSSRILIYYNVAPSFATFLPVILLVSVSNIIILHSND
ncbi:MAG: YjgP/YjgQ family permease [Rickettsiaceae bacterium]|nr:MAG: YjgP/YjgQ family permease [Rickettsiaceae bacterium]